MLNIIPTHQYINIITMMTTNFSKLKQTTFSSELYEYEYGYRSVDNYMKMWIYYMIFFIHTIV